MIIRTKQRAEGQQLATNLLNPRENEITEVWEIHNAVAQNLHGAFEEWEAIASGTKCQNYLYTVSINPDPAQKPLTKDQIMDFIARAEEKLGLIDHPRAILFHVKEGRPYYNVVWSRINSDKMKSIKISHDRIKLRVLVKDFARDHNIILPPGMRTDKDPAYKKTEEFSLVEKHQERRTGIPIDDRRHIITQAWNQTRNGLDFATALKDRGYILARGDKGVYALVDAYGEIYSLSRQITDVNTQDIKARLQLDCPLETLPAATVIKNQRVPS